MKPKTVPQTFPPPTEQQLVQRVHALAIISGGMHQDHPHFQQRLKERGINMRQVIETVKKGKAMGPPALDQWGDWRIKMKRVVAGRRIQVVVAVKSDHFVIITVI